MPQNDYKTHLGLIFALAVSVNANADGYFLSAQQKQELVLRGQLHDEQQRLYDIWIVPGYVVPLNHVEKGWSNAGEALQHYGEANFYGDIKKYSNETWRYGHKTILNKYTFTGTKNAWQSDMATASQRTQKRVFGWWLAYPWGIFEATTESALRLVTGIPIGVAVAASAYTVVPAITMAWPVVESVGFATIQGTAYPVVASAWNTVVAPPLALFGQQPAPERADGFWMKQVDDPNLQAVADVVIAWQRQLAVKTPLSNQDKKAQIQQLYQQIRALEQQVQQDEQQQQAQQINQLLLNAQQQKSQLEAELQAKGLSLAMLARNRQAIKVKLSVLNLSFENLDKLLDVMLADGAPNNLEERSSDNKTDPLQRSLDILRR